MSNFEADRLDGIETSLPDSDENIETASERGDEDMTGELPKIEDGLNRLKPTNFRCELLDYDNVKNWKARMKQLLSLQQCWQVMETTMGMVKNKQAALLEKAMENNTMVYEQPPCSHAHYHIYQGSKDQSAIRDMTVSGEVLMAKYEAVNKTKNGNGKEAFQLRERASSGSLAVIVFITVSCFSPTYLPVYKFRYTSLYLYRYTLLGIKLFRAS